MENKVLDKSFKVYFIGVAVLMYYFLNETLSVGVFVTYRHVFALLLVFSTFFLFLIKPNIARGVSTLKPAFVFSFPLIVTISASLFIWFAGTVDTDVISRGLSGALFYCNIISFTLAAVSFLYVFGEKGIWYNLISILISNILTIITIILQNGIGVFFSEFIKLVVSFADEAGEVIVQAEIHELAFCLGAYLIYMLLKPRKDFIFYILLALSVFCFLAAFKRIGMIAVVIALATGYFLRFVAKWRKSTAINLSIIISVCLVLILIGYIAIIKMDVFTLLEKAGINTNGRVQIYDAVDQFYEFSPDFLGNGIGYLTYQLSSNLNVGVSAVHNDFLQYYIDLGFWGYILWLASMTVLRVYYFGKNGKTDGAILALALTVYLVIISSTDNTMNYPLITTVLGIIMIGHGFDDSVRESEKNMFGFVSKSNEKKENSLIL